MFEPVILGPVSVLSMKIDLSIDTTDYSLAALHRQTGFRSNLAWPRYKATSKIAGLSQNRKGPLPQDAMGIPDEQIYPYATAEAAKTVAKHQAPEDLVFYAGWFCPFVQRAWIALEEKGIPYQYKEVNPYKKEPHFLAINPKGLVPALEYKGKALYESLVLCEFFEDAFPDHKPQLLPGDPVDRALARMWLDHITKTFIPPLQRLLQLQESDRQAEARQELYQSLRKFTDNIKGPYFFGDQFGLVDIAIAPWIVRDWVLEEHRGYKRIDVNPKWKEYADLVEKRDTVVKTTSSKEHLVEIHGRYLRDEAQSEAAKAVRAGRVIP